MTKLSPIFQGRVEEYGKLTITLSDKFDEYLHTLKGQAVEVIVRKPSNPIRSGQQNKFYWKVYVGTISEETGYSKDQVHEILKAKFLICGEYRDKKDNNIYPITKSTSDLTTDEFTEFLSQVATWASLQGWWIPDIQP